MEINKTKLIHNLNVTFKDDCKSTTQLWSSSTDESIDMDKLLSLLADRIIDPRYTEQIGRRFESILPLILTKNLNYDMKQDETFFIQHRRKTIALAKLVTISPHAKRFVFTYFSKMPSPFAGDWNTSTRKKVAKTKDAEPTPLDILKSCYTFLKLNTSFFRQQWKWSELIENYGDLRKQSDEYKLIYNHILALLTGMTNEQMALLNKDIPVDIKINFTASPLTPATDEIEQFDAVESFKWNLSNELYTNVEGVLLPMFDVKNTTTLKNDKRIVMVESARQNLRSIAIGVEAGKAVCLSGSVGSGKTTLIEYLASETGRIPIRQFDIDKSKLKENSSISANDKATSSKRKAIEMEQMKTINEHKVTQNGFLRIQLGDQTDSKMLLGQYHCTDVPGEFVWQPGVLTQAVMNGYWLLLEDLDQCSRDVCVMLTNFFENNYLSVPGFRDCIQISPGFQLFVTRRSHEKGLHGGRNTNSSYFQLLEKYLYTINMLPLSRTELCEIVCEKYPKLSTVADRIVDVFSMFSSDAKDFMESGVKDSGRLVSTRDLLKLCSRSSPTFSITSTECAYFVFQNAVDLFCSHLTQGDGKNNLIVNIGAKLGIIPSRCEYLSNEYKPDVSIDDGAHSIRVGRITLSRRDANGQLKRTTNTNRNGIDDDNGQKRLRIDADSNFNVYQNQTKQKTPHFSFTRLASCLLERIAVAVQENEPVLLVGETGVGKTSSVQYLAHQTNHKLVVINMNNQSDVSDLIGGFKPVDLAFVIAPLRAEFECLFKETFDASKNEKFLNNISICCNQENFNVLIPLMLRIVGTVFTRKSKNADNLSRWTALKIKLTKLKSQLEQSLNISFAFIAGPLVNCIKNGDWVLLDEINLASPETLECLSTILEPNGSIVLLEKGDFVPVKRHSDFRIFACMNPSTDIGKKDLTIGIRNRFTEFFVDELVLEGDLIILVSDYLRHTGIQGAKVLAIVQLYRKLRAMAQLELNDGLGNRPVYSLRTLCRALIICSKNLCGSIERNLYESFCLSFLTQLDPASHLIVLNLIQKTLVPTNQKAVLSQGLPKPKDNVEYANFEGYWIKLGPKSVQSCEHYIITESVRENLRDLARIISIGQLPVLLQGPTSAGKTSLIDYVAKRSGNYCLRINNHEHTDLQEYIGTYTADVTGKLVFKEGVLVQAMRNGYWIILDELNLAPSDILEALNRVLDDNRELFIPETQELIRAHPNFMLFATQNPPGLYGGRKMLSRAFKNRFVELHFSDIPKHELEIILEKRCLIPKSYAQKMVKTMTELQVHRTNTAKSSFTLRDLFRWGNRYTYANKDLLNNKGYDWNQHLVDEGYLVLSSRVRNESEIETIESALFTNFRKKIVFDDLFNLHEKTSQVTRPILESLKTYDCDAVSNVVWTSNMRQMAVLTGKALEFNEPVLLVGQTGCGKTTICQILASIVRRRLRILNCHMHTEGADFLGGLRPYRGNDENDMDTETDDSKNRKLFQWNDGPLIQSMTEGTFFLADEISLAEDSVLERLNCVLEPERTILLAEKGGCDENLTNDLNNPNASEFVISANDGFQFLATMNPSGDFGKKELSPALRNRFTEIWCRSADNEHDLVLIAEHALRIGSTANLDEIKMNILKNTAIVIVKTIRFIKENVEKFHYSVRDILAWVQFITINSTNLPVHHAIIFGLETMFLDSLEMLPHADFNEIEIQRKMILEFVIDEIQMRLKETFNLNNLAKLKGIRVMETREKFGINPFFINVNGDGVSQQKRDFKFTAPTTQKNLFRLLSAMSLHKAILLEGPPGVGKTSLIENVSSAIGYQMVRINLCEHTDLTDLFGTDQPSDEGSLSLTNVESDQKSNALGSFVWRDGPLLAALKAPNTWILLDELNLAPQSVLEGLNAILDHRGEVYVPELNKTFKLDKQTRIFASQNPLRQGGGRKGLPQSFLNRFTKVYLRTLDAKDLCHIIYAKYSEYFEQLKNFLLPVIPADRNLLPVSYFKSTETATIFDCCERMVSFSEKLDEGITNLEFGYKGGPYEVNLRDILRWCELLSSKISGFIVQHTSEEVTILERYNNFMLILYEKMQLVYCHRMRTDTDKQYIRNVFGEVFHCNADQLEKLSCDISFYWNDEFVHFNDVRLSRAGQQSTITNVSKMAPLMLNNQRQLIKALGESVLMETPVILCGPSDSGKTKLVDILCTLSNHYCNIDTIDDSVTGTFQQVDLNRHLEEIAQKIEAFLVNYQQNWILHPNQTNSSQFVKLLKQWEIFIESNIRQNDKQTETVMSEELLVFNKRVSDLSTLLESLLRVNFDSNITNELNALHHKLNFLGSIVKKRGTLNTGGHFEWVDSKIVRALKIGQYICLEHVNLCSSAILDRLNSVFETDGKLLLSEKGVESNNLSENVSKHKDFRAFLTLDPRNGEISRAMRNRCIELNLMADTYSRDDLKEFIYSNGIHEMHLIEWTLNIHHRVQQVSEFHSFNVSHLMKFAFLINENRRLGADEATALFDSAIVVYVRSSHIDLLGMGLNYYHDKLIEEIRDEINNVPDKCQNLVQLSNQIITADNLTSLSLIRLQCEPLMITIDCLTADIDTNRIKKVFAAVREKFSNLPIDLDWKSAEYLLHLVYEMSSIDDVSERERYLENRIREKLMKTSENYHNQLTILIELNHTLAQTIREIPSRQNIDVVVNKVPWNQHIFPRLRDYYDKTPLLSKSNQLKLSAILLAHSLFEKINCDTTKVKQSYINAITYSKVVMDGTIPNGLNIDLITQLHPLLDYTKTFAIQMIRESETITYKQYGSLICAYLWANRLYEVSKNRLFKGKSVDKTLIDKLALHFNWLVKHLLCLLNEINGENRITAAVGVHQKETAQFRKILQQISDCNTIRRHPLNEMRKKFTKRLTEFMPFYEQNQIVLHEHETEFIKQMQLPTKNWQSFEPAEYLQSLINKYRIILSDDSKSYKSYLIDANDAEDLQWLVDDNGENEAMDVEKILAKLDSLSKSTTQFLGITTMSSVDDLTEQNEKFNVKHLEATETNSNQKNLAPLKLVVSVLPIMEYFALRAFHSTLRRDAKVHKLNMDFFKSIRSLDVTVLKSVQTIITKQYAVCVLIWDWLHRQINSNDFENVFNVMPQSIYRKISSFMKMLDAKINGFVYNSLALNHQCHLNVIDVTKQSQTMPLNSCALTVSAFLSLFNEYGQSKSIGLGNLEVWTSTLTSISKLLWNNVETFQHQFQFEHTNIEYSQRYGRKLLAEIKYIQALTNSTDKAKSEIEEEFIEMIQLLEKKTENINMSSDSSHTRFQQFYASAVIQSLAAVIELHLMTFTPLVDPVEKNRLKKTYAQESQQHLTKLTSAYDFMKVIMSYNGLGEQILHESIDVKYKEFKTLLEKYSKKCALRPDVCVYAELVDQINFFLENGCRPKSQLQLINDIDTAFNRLNSGNLITHQDLQNVDEIIKRIDWCTNTAESFERSTIIRFNTYYRDFTAPLESSIIMLKNAFRCLKQCLTKMRDIVLTTRNGSNFNGLNQEESLSTVLVNLIEFPSVEKRSHLMPVTVRMLESLENKDVAHSILLKSVLQETLCLLSISGSISDSSFQQFDLTIGSFNKMWKQQEEIKRAKSIEEESLYVKKTRCADEDEEEITEQEIETMFPNYATTDFGEFVQYANLEDADKKESPVKPKPPQDLLTDDDLKFVGDVFIDIMHKYSSCNYHKPSKIEFNSDDYQVELMNAFESKSNVFYQLIQKYKHSLSSTIDDAFYGGIGLLIFNTQNRYRNQNQANFVRAKPYNFYKDQNIPEVYNTGELLDRIEARVLNELKQWPDHAVLNDIILIIGRIRSLDITEPIARFNTGFQILRQKIDEWNSVSHKLNHLRDLETEVAEYVQRWMKLELQCWRECLATTADKVKSKAYRYWFFMYNLLHEYLDCSITTFSCDLTDFEAVEKYFGEGEIDIDAENGQQTGSKLRTADVVSVLKQFIESSNYGEFDLRMKILKSFEMYLHQNPSKGSTKKRERIISIIHNLHTYYTQFVNQITETIKTKRSQIEKKLKEFVKIESYNKDLSYYGMRNNVARVHRHLFKFLREFETALMEKIAEVFVWKANETPSLNDEPSAKGSNSAYEPNIASYTVDVKHFVLAQLPKSDSIPADSSNDDSLLAKIDKLFGVSRNVVKNAVLHAEFPSLLYNLDMELATQIETCNYLRGLEVDRKQEKPKQKSQAKHILTQKRKAIADTFKMLTTLGLSFRSGMLESQMQTDFIDLKLNPFNIQCIIDAPTKCNPKINQSLALLTKNIDLNFSKCVFKFKLLQTAMLTPNQELGLPNIERIKGFTIDMFLLVQLQRQTLCKSTIELQKLQEYIKRVDELKAILSNDEKDLSFNRMSSKLMAIEHALIQISDITEQYELLLNCVPADEDKVFTAIDSTDVIAFTKSSVKYQRMKSAMAIISKSSKTLLTTVQSTKDSYFLNSTVVHGISKKFNRIIDELKNARDNLKLSQSSEYLVIAKPLVKLLQSLNIDLESNEMIIETSDENNSHQNIVNELENIVHHVLLSIQNIYKKYSTQKPKEETADVSAVENANNNQDDEEDDDEETIQKNHLKQKITAEINTDWQTLGLSSVSMKLSKICAEIYHSQNDANNVRIECIRKLVSIQPILEQFELLCKYYLLQQLVAHKVSTKMFSVMLIIFIELTTKGFCIPPDLMQDDDGQQNENGDGKEGEGFGLDDGTGEKDVSDKIESEDQLDTAKKPGDRDENKKDDEDCEETNGIDMSEDFDSKLQDIEKRGDDSSDDEESDNEELDKEMGDTEQGADKLDDQIWGSDEEKDEEEEEGDDEMNDETDAKGSKEDQENHNNLDSEQNDQGQGDEQDGLDATNENQQEKQKKKDQIDKMNEDETVEDQINPYHNELEEPPEPEDMDLGDVNLDNQDNNDNNDEQNDENPFDIDSMKENMQIEDDENDEPDEDGEGDEKTEQQQDDLSDNSDIEDGDDLKKDQEPNKEEDAANGEDKNEEEAGNNEPDTQEPGKDVENTEEDEDQQEETDDAKEKNKNENFHESVDKPSNEDNIQAMPDTRDQGTTDQVETEANEKNKQEDNMDAQDTGEEQNGIGQAANEESKSGHQGKADNKNTQKTEQSEKKEQKDRRKPGATNEERTISENKTSENKQLKTVQEVDQGTQNEEDESNNDTDDRDNEYQHIKDATESEKSTTTMDNATEEQSKKVAHDDEKEETITPECETNDELMEQDTKNEPLENVPELENEKLNENSKNNKKGANNDRQNDICEPKEECTVEGDAVSTHTVSRPDNTTAHCSIDIIRDASVAQELDNAELLDIRKMYEKERTSNKLSNPIRENFDQWQKISNEMLPNARELCEQLRLILEPTKCTRLKGDYRTGRRINMKKIIPYIASQFRKDKIWLRRTKPAQRDYHITIAIDDSKSMDYNESKELTLQAISLVSQALTLLESGRLSIMSFGESPKIILNHTDQFDGPTLVNSLNFAQNQSRIAELMEFIRVANSEDTGASSDNGIFENLLLVLSDGRNIFSEGEKKVKNAIKLARLSRVFIVYIIIDNPKNDSSILDIRVPHFSADRKTVTMKSYLDTFPFPYYVIVRDLKQLPLVLSDAMRQWFELVSSEQ
ncbi:midasin [Contarinia nasturtii]|uniref:midasin n=1 Tax=Contarinia nasturtii TaxID=265458 RepID=UPI0012D3B089|nr:midasin [Contarinia nasturtii]